MVRFIFIDLDIREYISSGIIESYALGVVSDQERREVECMATIYPELQDHLLTVQQNIEILGQRWVKEPPADLKSRVMEGISSATIEEKTHKEVVPSTTVIALPNQSMSSKLYTIKWLAAASIALFVGALSLFVIRNSQLKGTQQVLNAKEKRIQVKNGLLKNLQIELKAYNEEREFLINDKTIAINLLGTPVSPGSKVKVYWNQEKSKMVLVGMNLPKTSMEKQYQLWAIVDGKPVDLGVLDRNENPKVISRQASVKNVQAFAITLEKIGGSPSPNLEQMFVVGNVVG